MTSIPLISGTETPAVAPAVAPAGASRPRTCTPEQLVRRSLLQRQQRRQQQRKQRRAYTAEQLERYQAKKLETLQLRAKLDEEKTQQLQLQLEIEKERKAGKALEATGKVADGLKEQAIAFKHIAISLQQIAVSGEVNSNNLAALGRVIGAIASGDLCANAAPTAVGLGSACVGTGSGFFGALP